MIVGEFVALRTVCKQQTKWHHEPIPAGEQQALGRLPPPDNLLAFEEETLERVGLHETFCSKDVGRPASADGLHQGSNSVHEVPRFATHD